MNEIARQSNARGGAWLGVQVRLGSGGRGLGSGLAIEGTRRAARASGMMVRVRSRWNSTQVSDDAMFMDGTLACTTPENRTRPSVFSRETTAFSIPTSSPTRQTYTQTRGNEAQGIGWAPSHCCVAPKIPSIAQVCQPIDEFCTHGVAVRKSLFYPRACIQRNIQTENPALAGTKYKRRASQPRIRMSHPKIIDAGVSPLPAHTEAWYISSLRVKCKAPLEPMKEKVEGG